MKNLDKRFARMLYIIIILNNITFKFFSLYILRNATRKRRGNYMFRLVYRNL